MRGKSMASTCIRDTAPCRTDEPLGRLTFFHAAACPFDYEHRPVRVLFFSRSHRVHLARAFSFSPTAVHPVRARPVHISLLSLALILPVRSPISFATLARSDRSFILSLRVYHSFPQQCRRRAGPIGGTLPVSRIYPRETNEAKWVWTPHESVALEGSVLRGYVRREHSCVSSFLFSSLYRGSLRFGRTRRKFRERMYTC